MVSVGSAREAMTGEAALGKSGAGKARGGGSGHRWCKGRGGVRGEGRRQQTSDAGEAAVGKEKRKRKREKWLYGRRKKRKVRKKRKKEKTDER